jgi:hypothetical protein
MRLFAPFVIAGNPDVRARHDESRRAEQDRDRQQSKGDRKNYPSFVSKNRLDNFFSQAIH